MTAKFDAAAAARAATATCAAARAAYTAATEQVLVYNLLVIEAQAKGLKRGPRLGIQVSPTFRSLGEGEKWISQIRSIVTPFTPEARVDLGF